MVKCILAYHWSFVVFIIGHYKLLLSTLPLSFQVQGFYNQSLNSFKGRNPPLLFPLTKSCARTCFRIQFLCLLFKLKHKKVNQKILIIFYLFLYRIIGAGGADKAQSNYEKSSFLHNNKLPRVPTKNTKSKYQKSTFKSDNKSQKTHRVT